MTTINVWSKVAVAVQTALAAAKTISAITKASPAVASSTAHGYADGDLLLLKIVGMRQLNLRIVRVDNSVTDAFDLEGIDSTLFDTFVSGTAEKITFGANAATFQDVSATGGDAQPIPISLIHDDQDFEIPGNRTPVNFNCGSLWDVSDPALLALAAFDEIKGLACIEFRFSTGHKLYFVAYPSASLTPNGSSGQAVTTPVTLRLRSRLKTYAS
jgi:hypothetical protein